MSTNPSELQEWQRKRQHYQRPAVVNGYDQRRFESPRHRGTTPRKWELILKAFGSDFASVDTVLDLPCGTGRFTEQLLGAGKRLINADISLPMLQRAAERGQASERFVGSVRLEGERLALADCSVDAVMSIRFLFHVPHPIRIHILREFARVSRRFVLLDVRHKYCVNMWLRWLRAELIGGSVPPPRYGLGELRRELLTAGLGMRRMAWNVPPFSDKLVILCEKQ